MKKIFLFVFVSCLVCMSSFGQDIILEPLPGMGGNGQGKPKSLTEQVLASLENGVLTLSFTPSTSSQVVITDSQTNTVVYSGVFGVASSQVILLSSLPAGEYELFIYAYEEWWRGEFVIEEE